MKSYSKYLVATLALTLLGCSEKYRRQDYPDPLAKIFWGKGVKVMIAYDVEAPSIADTTIFDAVGNQIEEIKNWSHLRQTFDSLHFITRKLSKGEQVSNYQIRYKSESKAKLKQEWSGINHFNWEFTPTEDFDPDVHFNVIFNLDADGFVMDELNEHDGILTTYSYDDAHNLQTKEVVSLSDQKLLQKWSFQYDDEVLVKADHYWNGELVMEYFCSKMGLIDSARYKKDTIINYTYEYYK
jgi:hypothetical protein